MSTSTSTSSVFSEFCKLRFPFSIHAVYLLVLPPFKALCRAAKSQRKNWELQWLMPYRCGVGWGDQLGLLAALCGCLPVWCCLIAFLGSYIHMAALAATAAAFIIWVFVLGSWRCGWAGSCEYSVGAWGASNQEIEKKNTFKKKEITAIEWNKCVLLFNKQTVQRYVYIT